MSMLAIILVTLIALLHLYIAWFEIFAWETRGPNVFASFPKDLFTPTKSLAANQGIYNAFLAAGLLWSLFINDPVWARNVATCYLIFVAVAGIFGAATASKKILYVQTVPATIALLAVWFT
ncbi:hypothetical protein BFP76_04150 [Amylibacter kogurei]|uniref:Epimerase n=1 Tax=Paramylibacter kogurei TaxID=1889778 RepID=A0A2G5K4D6_9RHOB|nr:DUF1304 domain-containing protein [Amylibacter kogurei]PIB24408.1 hypothetical protein BFP76_04150 [Amylibacter kogurei]